MVEAFAVASGKGGTGKTTATLALGMALADEYDVTVVDADTGMANLLFHAGLADVDVTLHDLLVADADATVADATYHRHGMRVVPCGTDLAAFDAADPTRLREVVATLAADTDVLLLDSPATLESRSAVLPLVLADRTVLVLQPTVPAISDGLKVQEYATTYGTGVAGVLFNKVHDPAHVDRITEQAGQYFEGPILGTVPEDEAARAARRDGDPLLAAAPESDAARGFRAAAAAILVDDGTADAVADRFRSAVIPDEP
ncbi:MAG: P-loop NTPase [Halobacteriaceae archaeon]